jgi:hypothetical protein
LSRAGLLLAAALVAYIVLDVLLTPIGGFETRDPAKVHVIGLAGLALLFVGLVLGIVALVLLFRGSRRAPLLAIVAALLYYPAFLTEQTGTFSSLPAPTAIDRLELVQAVVAAIAIGIGFWMLRAASAREATGRS